MPWVKVNSQLLHAARYDAERNRLDVRMANGRTVRHADILPHMYEAILSAEDPDFYYRNYIQPTAVGVTSGIGVRFAQGLMLVVLLAVIWLASATQTSIRSDPASREAGRAQFAAPQLRLN